ncbi:MAG: hypothetical protein J5601_03025 [Elusimicrobiaceae bacterium]|nr:hypothetical protein [Elusimicrobiaceae bacterium]
MKKLFLFLLLCCCSLAHAKPLPPPPLKTLTREQVMRLAERAQQNFASKMDDLCRVIAENPIVIDDTKILKLPIAARTEIPTIQVQLHSYSNNTASAGTLMVDGEESLFLAGHLANLIKGDPWAKYITPDGEKIVAPIEGLYITDEQGIDIAVAPVPEALKPYIKALSPDETLVEAGTPVTISGFAQEQPVSLRGEMVLFATPMRYLIRMSEPIMMGGTCGGTIQDSATDKLVGMQQQFSYYTPTTEWFAFLPDYAQQRIRNAHYAVPIQNVVATVRAARTGNPKLAAIEMKALGRPIALLYPNQHIESVSLLRDGFVKKSVHFNAFLDPQHLEELFAAELRKNDPERCTLRIIVVQRPSMTERGKQIFYDVDILTGKVKSFTR